MDTVVEDSSHNDKELTSVTSPLVSPAISAKSDEDQLRKLSFQAPSSAFLSTNVPTELLSSVVKVFCIKTEPNHSMPWQMRRQTSSTGSGFVIDGKRIITNAHCVAYHTSVRVRKHGSAQKFVAKVLAVGHPCDLAILTVEDESFWCDLEPLVFGGIPNLQEAVTTVGYPTGGDNICVTKGVVSRVEETYYSHGCARLLAIQVDAAINSGNSGGPALMCGKVVGVCFETLTNAENIGYIIPVPVIEHFLMDVQRPGPHLRGFCDLGIQVQLMESDILRRSMGMTAGQTGLLVNKVAPLVNTAKVVKRDDVLIEIDGIPVGNDGTIPFRDGERVSFRYQLLRKFVGDKVTLTLLRDKVIEKVDVELGVYPYLCPVQQHDIMPSYIIFAGFVFQILAQPYLHSEWSKDWKKKAPIKMVEHHIYHLKEFEEQELVVISQILVSDTNVGYSSCSPSLVTSVNGEKIRNLRHLAILLDEIKINFEKKMTTEIDGADAIPSEFLRLELEDGRIVILDVKEALESSQEILKQQNIPYNMSQDLRDEISKQGKKE